MVGRRGGCHRWEPRCHCRFAAIWISWASDCADHRRSNSVQHRYTEDREWRLRIFGGKAGDVPMSVDSGASSRPGSAGLPRPCRGAGSPAGTHSVASLPLPLGQVHYTEASCRDSCPGSLHRLAPSGSQSLEHAHSSAQCHRRSRICAAACGGARLRSVVTLDVPRARQSLGAHVSEGIWRGIGRGRAAAHAAVLAAPHSTGAATSGDAFLLVSKVHRPPSTFVRGHELATQPRHVTLKFEPCTTACN